MNATIKRILSVVPILVVVAILMSIPAFALEASDFALTVSGSVTVDGTEDQTVNVAFSANSAMSVIALQGTFSTTETEGTGYLKLSDYVSPVELKGFNYFDIPSGTTVYGDSALEGYAVEQNGNVMTAVYTVDKDTPTGSYTVQFSVVDVQDYEFNTVSNRVYTATIEVTNLTMHIHNYGNPTWEWTEDSDSEEGYTATATFTCDRGTGADCPWENNTYTREAERITVPVKKEATCTADGSKTLEASVTLDGKTYNDYPKVVIPALGHDYEDGVCTRCGAYKPVEPSKENGVYLIGTAAELTWLADYVNNFSSSSGAMVNARLTDDIEVSEGWVAIGIYSETTTLQKPYAGTFDGDNHTVTLHGEALFGYVKGTVQNVITAGTVNKNSNNTFGNSISNLGALANVVSRGCVENCHNTASVSGSQMIGGLIGRAETGNTITNCSNSGTVSGKSGYVGGLIGDQYGSTVSSCYNSGTVSAGSGVYGYSYVGGLVGYGNQAKIYSCYNTGSVSGAGTGVGGILGYTYGTSGKGCIIISNCYNSGEVSTTYALGTYMGAVIGQGGNTYYEVENSYYLDGSCLYGIGSGSKVGTGTPESVTDDELKALAETLGEDFKTASANVNSGYPILTWQADEEEPDVPNPPVEEDGSVQVYTDYVGGYSLIVVYGDAEGYLYDGNAMYRAAYYDREPEDSPNTAFVYIVEGAPAVEDVLKLLSETEDAAEEITASDDVNGSGSVDIADVQAVADCYNGVGDLETYMEVYLRADVNADHVVNSKDAESVLENRN